LLRDYGIEVGGGLGAFHGKVWRIGLMGESSARAHVWSLLGALDTLFLQQRRVKRSGLAQEAAARSYDDMPSRKAAVYNDAAAARPQAFL